MKTVPCSTVLAIAVLLVAACSRPNLKSTGGGYEPGATAPAASPAEASETPAPPEDGGAAGTSG